MRMTLLFSTNYPEMRKQQYQIASPQGEGYTTLAYISLERMMAVLGLTRCTTLAHISLLDDDACLLVCAADADHRLPGAVQQCRQGARRWLGGKNPGHPRPRYLSRNPRSTAGRCVVDCSLQVPRQILALQHHDSLSGFVIQPEQRTSHAVLWIAPSRFHFECLQFSILSVLLTHNLSRRPHQACAVLHGILHGSIQNTSLLP